MCACTHAFCALDRKKNPDHMFLHLFLFMFFFNGLIIEIIVLVVLWFVI